MPVSPDQESHRKSIPRNPLLYSSAVVAVVLAGVVFVMVSRWQHRRSFERQAAQERAEKQREQDRLAVEQLGGKEFAILSFYANPTEIKRGESAQLCYGVANAKTVTIEPEAPPAWPSVAHCVDVSPKKSMTYTLSIEDAGGNKKTQDVEVRVR
jgi:hypothetical protein